MTNLTRSTVVAALLLAAACGDAESAEQQTLEVWCEALVEMDDLSDALLEPERSTAEEQQRATEAAERFYATDPPAEIADAVSTVYDGPADGNPMAVPEAASELTAYAEDNCDELEPELTE